MFMNDWLNLHFFAPDDEGGSGGGLPTGDGDAGGEGDKGGLPTGDGDAGGEGDGKDAGAEGDGDKGSSGKTDDGKSKDDAGQGDKTETASDEGFQLTVPEGAENHAEAIDAFQGHMTDWLKENPKATVQDALQEGVNYQKKLHEDALNEAVKEAEEQATGWLEEIKADKEIGGDAFDENAAAAQLAIEKFGSPKLKELLDATGLGNHPEVFRFAFKASKALKETGNAKGEPGGKEPGVKETLYG